jgi:hypothetical protein
MGSSWQRLVACHPPTGKHLADDLQSAPAMLRPMPWRKRATIRPEKKELMPSTLTDTDVHVQQSIAAIGPYFRSRFSELPALG